MVRYVFVNDLDTRIQCTCQKKPNKTTKHHHRTQYCRSPSFYFGKFNPISTHDHDNERDAFQPARSDHKFCYAH